MNALRKMDFWRRDRQTSGQSGKREGNLRDRKRSTANAKTLSAAKQPAAKQDQDRSQAADSSRMAKPDVLPRLASTI